MINRRSKIIFIHSLFRTGSTYLWSTLKKNKKSVCYYEPLNEQLLNENENFAIDNIDSNRHTGLADNYFNEYKNAEDRFPYFKKSMVVDEFCKVSSQRLFKNYIDYLIKLNNMTINVFQFNRTSLRSEWFNANYLNSKNIYLYRNSKDQWRSILDQYLSGNPYFLAMNLLSISKNLDQKPFKSLANLIHFPDIPHDIDRNEKLSFEHDYNFACQYVFYLTLEEHYLIHYSLWKLCYNYNQKHCGMCIDMTMLNKDPRYQDEISAYFQEQTNFVPCFKDIRLPEYTNPGLNQITTEKIEQLVDTLVEQINLNTG